jgi:NitT/TauT family transport system substrate-binding protein
MRGSPGKYRVLVAPGELPDIPAQLGIATGALIKQQPDKLRAIEAARRDGTRFIYEHTDEAIGILAKIYEPLPANEVAAMVKDLVAAKFWSEGRIEKPLLENTIRGMKYVGMIDKDIDVARLTDTSFLPADLQK